MSHFRAICLKITGEKPVDLLIKTRITHARQLLCHSDLTIGMIAEMLGYENAYYFSCQFHEITGMTARDYRKRFQ